MPGADNDRETAELTLTFNDALDYADRIKTYRKKYKLTQEQLAQVLDINHLTLRSWEQKQAKPPYHIWRQHKHLFDDPVDLP